MKRDYKSVFLGFFCILLAILVLLNKILDIKFNIPWITVFLSGLWIWFIFKSFSKKNYVGAFLFAGLLFCQVRKYTGLENIPLGTAIIVAILLGFGVQFLTKSGREQIEIKRYDDEGNEMEFPKGSKCESEEDGMGGTHVKITNGFSATIKYANASSLKKVSIDNTFGSVVCYLNEATLQNNSAEIKIDNAFGSVKLYVPNNWRINVTRDNIIGSISLHGNFVPEENASDVLIKADNAFGSIDIYYV